MPPPTAIETPTPNPVSVAGAHRTMTYEEFLEAPEIYNAEWVNGEVMEMTAPSWDHQQLSRFLMRLFEFHLERRPDGAVCAAPINMKLGIARSGREPDILFLLSENLQRIKRNYVDGPADLVVEIISPESRGRDRGDKFYEYEQAGVREYWLIDPERRKAEFYALGADGTYEPVIAGADGVFRSRLLEGFTVKTDWLWAEVKPTRAEIAELWG